MCFGRRQLHEYAAHRAITIQGVDEGQEVFLLRVRREVMRE